MDYTLVGIISNDIHKPITLKVTYKYATKCESNQLFDKSNSSIM